MCVCTFVSGPCALSPPTVGCLPNYHVPPLALHPLSWISVLDVQHTRRQVRDGQWERKEKNYLGNQKKSLCYDIEQLVVNHYLLEATYFLR